jgi:hypothetical protein
VSPSASRKSGGTGASNDFATTAGRRPPFATPVCRVSSSPITNAGPVCQTASLSANPASVVVRPVPVERGTLQEVSPRMPRSRRNRRRVVVWLDPSTLRLVDRAKQENGFPTRSATIRSMLRLFLKPYPVSTKTEYES